MSELACTTNVKSQDSPLSFFDKLQDKVLGSSSRHINETSDFFAKVNGGTMQGVMQHDYQKDFLCEMNMRDSRVQQSKDRRGKINFRRNTITQAAREKDTKRKLVILD